MESSTQHSNFEEAFQQLNAAKSDSVFGRILGFNSVGCYVQLHGNLVGFAYCSPLPVGAEVMVGIKKIDLDRQRITVLLEHVFDDFAHCALLSSAQAA